MSSWFKPDRAMGYKTKMYLFSCSGRSLTAPGAARSGDRPQPGLLNKYIKIIVVLLSVILAGLVSSPVQADHGPLSDKDKALFEGVGYDQKLDQQLPLDMTFRDEAGRSVKIGDYFGEKPVILMMAYYECPMLCTLVLNGLLDSMEALDFDIGQEFEVVTISMDPGETPAMATAKKETYLNSYGRPGGAEGWHFLTGSPESIAQVTEAIGFRYVYDETVDEYAHPTGMVLLTPGGRISRYFYGIEFDSAKVRLGLVEASNNQIGSPIDQILLMCYHYDPKTGEYTPVIMNIIRLAGTATVLLIGIPIFATIFRNRRENATPAG